MADKKEDLSIPPINDPKKEDIKKGRGKDLKPRTRSKKPFLQELREEEVLKSFRMTKKMLKEVEEIAKRERLRSFTSAMQFLLQEGINSYNNK